MNWIPDQQVREDYQKVSWGPNEEYIPSDWDIKSINEISEDVIYPQRDKPEDLNGEIPWIRIEDLEGKYIAESDSGKGVTQETIRDMNLSVFPRGTLMCSCSGNMGVCAITERELISNQTFAGIVPSETIETEYLYYALGNRSEDLQRMSTGTTIAYLSSDKLNKFSIPYPPLREQRRIAEILSTVDEQIQQTIEIIKKTKELKKGLMQDLLIEGFSKNSTQEVQIGPRSLQIPEHWEMKSCGQLFNAVNGRAFKTEEWAEEGTQIIRIQDLRPDAKAETNYADFDVDKKYHVTEGDLLFCWAGNIKTSLGAYIWSGERAYLNQHIYNLRAKSELDKRFFAYSLNQHLKLLKTMVGGSAGQVHITKTDFEAFRLPVPPIEEQKKIGDIIEKSKMKTQEEKERKSKLEDLKSGLMQDLLTGKIRTRFN
ncbi:restriction endonuclease subunit S [Haloarchaeobius salinus]|uniref:restriction endonuclease subunit S n=1 Tax=Haloarchaeobius salinus TaxID=1198298 RepID=UPI002108FC5F|nr:restriction endonuclease subunit S [Haloarchaeobius salinus]